METATSNLRKTLVLTRYVALGLLVLLYLLAVHLSNVRGGHPVFSALLALGPIGLVALAIAWRSGRRVLYVAIWLVAAASIVARWHQLQAHIVWVYLLQQLGLYVLLGFSFGRTLAAGRVPMCTRLALREYGTLPVEGLRYTRQVTVVWTLFFLVTAAMILLLFITAPLRVWSACVNFGAPILIILMFAVEQRVRKRALPNMVHAGILATLRASGFGDFGRKAHRA